MKLILAICKNVTIRMWLDHKRIQMDMCTLRRGYSAIMLYPRK